jgi:hypothetical protein
LLLNKVTVANSNDKGNGSLATFFNPYASKNNDSMQNNKVILLAQGEQRTIVVGFRNRLGVPLEIPNCQLIFDKPSTMTDIEASPLSFILPPRVEKYSVHFPFTVASLISKIEDEKRNMDGDTCTESTCDSFEVIGVKISIFGRSFVIPFESSDEDTKINSTSEMRQAPPAVSNWTYFTSKVIPSRKLRIGLEVVPPQPNISVSFSNSHTSFDDSVVIPVPISDGEIVRIPSFRIVNDSGSSGHGVVKRFQIACVGLPGLPERILFDTDDCATNFIENKKVENDGVSVSIFYHQHSLTLWF